MPYVLEVVHRKQNLATRGCVIASYCVDNSGCPCGFYPIKKESQGQESRCDCVGIDEEAVCCWLLYELLDQHPKCDNTRDETD